MSESSTEATSTGGAVSVPADTSTATSSSTTDGLGDGRATTVSGPPSDPATAPVPTDVDPGPNPTPADPTVNQAPEPTPAPEAEQPADEPDEEPSSSVRVGDVVTFVSEDTYGNERRGYGLVTEIFEDKRQGLDGKWSEPADYARIAALPDAGIVALGDLNPDD